MKVGQRNRLDNRRTQGRQQQQHKRNEEAYRQRSRRSQHRGCYGRRRIVASNATGSWRTKIRYKVRLCCARLFSVVYVSLGRSQLGDVSPGKVCRSETFCDAQRSVYFRRRGERMERERPRLVGTKFPGRIDWPFLPRDYTSLLTCGRRRRWRRLYSWWWIAQPTHTDRGGVLAE